MRSNRLQLPPPITFGRSKVWRGDIQTLQKEVSAISPCCYPPKIPKLHITKNQPNTNPTNQRHRNRTLTARWSHQTTPRQHKKPVPKPPRNRAAPRSLQRNRSSLSPQTPKHKHTNKSLPTLQYSISSDGPRQFDAQTPHR